MDSPNPWMILPFVLLLGAIANGPLLVPKWWLRHYAKVALGLGAVTLGYYIFVLHDMHRLRTPGMNTSASSHWSVSLYVVSGGIHIGVKGEATPFRNVVFCSSARSSPIFWERPARRCCSSVHGSA